MPTGYTADVMYGKVTELEEYALACARAFGALIDMRDEPKGAEIKELEPSDYHSTAAKSLVVKLSSYWDKSEEEIHAEYEEYYRGAVAAAEESNANNRKALENYQAMLDKVRAWTPPTDDHHGLKRFMIEQLESSISYDSFEYDSPTRMDPIKWHQERIDNCNELIDYHTKNYREEVVRVKERNQWIRDLVNSFED